MATPRRGFLKTLVAVPLVPAASAVAQTPSIAPTPSPIPSPSPAAPGPVAEALTRVVEQRYGAQLDADALREIAKGIDDAQGAAERLRKAMKLTNADEPVTLFGARPPRSRA
ncbi:MAG: hypothetical protein ABW221_28350 [Vicinamibacteria bacterium]